MTTDPAPHSLDVFVVDDDAAVGTSIAVTLSSVGYRVLTFKSATDFLAQAAVVSPSVAIIDMILPGMTGLHLCREIMMRQMSCSFLIISGHADVPSTVEAMRMGAVDLLEKPFSRQRMLEVVNRAARIALRDHKIRLEEEEVTQNLESLSPRERVVFDAIAAGLVTKEISKQLGISERTVDVHRSRISQKLAIDSPSRLATLIAICERKSFRMASAIA